MNLVHKYPKQKISSDVIRCLSIVHGFFLAIAFNYTLQFRLIGGGGGGGLGGGGGW